MRSCAVTFLVCELKADLKRRLESEGVIVEIQNNIPIGSAQDASGTVAVAKRIGADWVVVDGYQFRSSFQKAFADNDLKLLMFDDFGHSRQYYADLILNQNIYANDGFYKHRAPRTRLLLGTRYVLLRNEFLKWLDWQRTIKEAPDNIFISLGGSDEHNCSLKILQAFETIDARPLNITVIGGPNNPHCPSSLESREVPSLHTISFLQDTKEVASLMANADLAFSAGGSTCWELCFMGLPFVTLILADNQVLTVEGLEAEGVSIDMGWHHKVTAERILKIFDELSFAGIRKTMSTSGKELVEGGGRQRVADVMLL